MIVNSKWSNKYSDAVSGSCLFKDAVHSDQRMLTKELTFWRHKQFIYVFANL